MPDLDALVFDLDGTLWDAAETTARGWSRAAQEQGLSRALTAADIGRVCGLPFDRCVETLFPELSPADRAALGPHLGRAEEEAVRRHGGILYPGVVSGLRRLSERAPVLLLSNCDRWYLEIFVEQSGLSSIFHDTLCYGDTGLEKDGNLRRLDELHGLGRVAYVGDTEGDRRACANAGVEFVYAAYGFGDLDATPAFGNFDDLCAHLEERVR